MSAYKGFLIDLDGTIYRGNEPIPEAIEFMKRLKAEQLPYIYVTNNSTTPPQKVAERLERMGAPATSENVLTTSLAAASFISAQKRAASVFYIGEEGLRVALEEEGLHVEEENPDYVIVGLDRELTYEKLTKACLAIRKGARFVSTNPDVAFPTEKGLAPGNGALTSLITASTGVKPVVIGKPESIIMEEAIRKMGLAKSDCLMIGDNYHTDILAGIHAEVDTLFVATGVTLLEDLKQQVQQPTHIVTTLEQWKL